MIETISIRNLKKYGEDPALFELAPITLLLGANSSGKSTLFQALLLLRQSWMQGLHRISKLRLQGYLVSLGHYGNAVHQHDATKEIELSLKIDGAQTTLCFRGSASSAAAQLVHVRLEGQGGVDANFHSNDDDATDPGVLFLASADGGIRLHKAGDDADLSALIASLKSEPSSIRVRIGDEARTVEIAGAATPPNDSAETALKDRVARLLDATFVRARNDIGTASHIGAVRMPCPRIAEGDTRNRRVGSKGEFVGNVLAGESGLIHAVNAGLPEMGIPYQIERREIGSTSSACEILVHHGHGEQRLATISVPDLGYGMGQLLPVLVEYLRLQREPISNHQHGSDRLSELLMVEQPELHLHPAWQAELATFFARGIETYRKDKTSEACQGASSPRRSPPPPQVLLETHSEHMVRRLQYHVRVGALQPDDVSLLMLQARDDGTTRVERVHLDGDGEFSVPWPGGFFPDPTLGL
jgi:hypothetical protein